jgi:diaminopimelate epimerase
LSASCGSAAAAASALKERKLAEDVVVTIHIKTPLLTNNLHSSHGEVMFQRAALSTCLQTEKEHWFPVQIH